jgi:hypothetical protein
MPNIDFRKVIATARKPDPRRFDNKKKRKGGRGGGGGSMRLSCLDAEAGRLQSRRWRESERRGERRRRREEEMKEVERRGRVRCGDGGSEKIWQGKSDRRQKMLAPRPFAFGLAR